MDTEFGRYQASKQTKTHQQFKYRGEVGIKCPHCGENVNPHMELCPACGCPLHADHCTFCGAPMIPGVRRIGITSKFGHDGFLLENDLLTEIINPILQ